MKVRLEQVESTSKKTKCCCCEALIFTGEKYTQVVNVTTGKAVRGERYCKHCEEYAVANWETELVIDEGPDEDKHLRKMERWAAYSAAGCTHAFWEDEDHIKE
jgi:hypothetical protein